MLCLLLLLLLLLLLPLLTRYMCGHSALRPEQSGRSPTRAEKTIRKAIAARRTRADEAEQQAESMQVSLTENNNPPNPVPNTETVWGHYSTLEQLRDLLRYKPPSAAVANICAANICAA